MTELKPILILFPFLWIAIVFGISFFYRKKKGIVFPNFDYKKHDFYEKKASGSSNKNFFTRIGGARNCLNVAVADKTLYVFPMFPFNLMFLPEIYNLEHTIPLDKIKGVEFKKEILVSSIEIIFNKNEQNHSIKLRLKKYEEFLGVLQSFCI